MGFSRFLIIFIAIFANLSMFFHFISMIHDDENKKVHPAYRVFMFFMLVCNFICTCIGIFAVMTFGFWFLQ